MCLVLQLKEAVTNTLKENVKKYYDDEAAKTFMDNVQENVSSLCIQSGITMVYKSSSK